MKKKKCCIKINISWTKKTLHIDRSKDVIEKDFKAINPKRKNETFVVFSKLVLFPVTIVTI